MRSPCSLTRGSVVNISCRWAAVYSSGSADSPTDHGLGVYGRRTVDAVGHEPQAPDDGEKAVGERGPRRPRLELVPVELFPQRAGVLQHRPVVDVVLGER